MYGRAQAKLGLFLLPTFIFSAHFCFENGQFLNENFDEKMAKKRKMVKKSGQKPTFEKKSGQKFLRNFAKKWSKTA